MSEIVGVQLFEGGKTQYFISMVPSLKIDNLCVVETEQGLVMARVVKTRFAVPVRQRFESMRRILRIATAKDLEQMKTNEQSAREAYRLCRKLVMDKELFMKLVDVKYTLDGRKAVFYFTSENRVDFRELVKDLAHALKVKIEMRQIGVRDEARRLGGVGCCGQPLCCCTFLKDFVSVSIRMAKDQNVSLNPTKVSGICGRLMCCLSYEYQGPKAKAKAGAAEAPANLAEAAPEAACAGCEAGGAAAKAAAPAPKGEKGQPVKENADAGGNVKSQRRWFRNRHPKKNEASSRPKPPGDRPYPDKSREGHLHS